ncbi:ribosomal protein S18 acetylase RimI-like enzyme [Natronobacillus azotifigens]|uniref:GNAT family N-acetyltransferase n=1 Tax=Natronobacillus azotifigens TaxID=472978 RepID=A0A9J6RD97_9BACI|nr:GNAT family N-acetyltransferase [Natronobacillus azotifigens]MCZ0703698.1 GNAT family N-acetyltransferase [Natronobacillus azotifigens]
MIYQDNLKGISSDMLNGFFVGWPDPPSTKTHLELLKKSSNVVVALNDNQTQVLGFITAISDGVLSAYIPFLEVLPEYQGQGIGEELVNQILKQLNRLYMVDLCCDDSLVPYYEKLGLLKTNGMCKRNYKMQSGTLS